MNELINNAIQIRDDIQTITDFLLKGLAPEDAQLQLIAKSTVLLGELDDTLEEIKDAACK